MKETSCWSACQSACSALIGQLSHCWPLIGWQWHWTFLSDPGQASLSRTLEVRQVCNKESRVTFCCRRNMLRVQGTMRDAYTIESDQKKVGHHSYFQWPHFYLSVVVDIFPWQFLFWCTAKMQSLGRRKRRGGQGWFDICVWENWRTLYPKLSNCQSRPCICIAEKN